MKILILFLIFPLALFAQTRPNIVLILMDDMGWNDLGAYTYPSKASPGPPPASVSGGSGTIDVPPPNPAYDAGAASLSITPRIDSLGDNGVRLTQFYATHPVCTPTRASLMTGSYATRVRLENVVGPYDDANRSDRGLNSTEITLPEYLRLQGYRTGMTGKWHLGHDTDFNPLRHGFESYFGILYSNDMWEPNTSNSWGPLQVMRGESALTTYTTDTGYTITQQIDTDAEQSYLLEALTDEAVDFIDASVADGRPFLLYYAPQAPHVPIHPHPGFLSTAGQTDPVARYYDQIREVDARVGEILDRLDHHGIANNTLVIFTSDNGPSQSTTRVQAGEVPGGAGSAYPFRGKKGETREGGHRVPFLARYPGVIPSGAVRNEAGVTYDLFTTLVTLAGGELHPGKTVDGQNLLPLLQGTDSSEPHSAFYFYKSGQTKAEAVMDLSSTDKWKYTEISGDSGDLFRIGDGFTGDFQESADVGGTQTAVQSALNSQLSTWNSGMTRRETGWVRSVRIELEQDAVTVDEGGTASVRVRLSASSILTVRVGRVLGDTDLMVSSGSELTFDAGNWDQWQTVTFSFAPDGDGEDGSALFRAYGASIGSSADVHVREIFVFENDTQTFSPPEVGRVWPKGNRVALASGQPLLLEATATDDGSPGALSTQWSRISGPGTVDFTDATALRTQATFETDGVYLLRFEADDTQTTSGFELEVQVGQAGAPLNGLSAYERLNDATTGTITGSAFAWGEGRIDGAWILNGQAQTWLETGAVAAAEASGVTLTAWVKMDAGAAAENRVIAQQLNGSGTGRTWLALKPDGSFFSYVGNAELSGGTLPMNTWTHVAMTAGGGTLRLWVNGVEVSNRSDTIENNTGVFRIGNHKNPSPGQQWIGGLDDVRVYTRVLTSAELGKVMGHANVSPVVDAAAGQQGKILTDYATGGSSSDDGNPGPLNVEWETVEGPPTAVFANPANAGSNVSFPVAGEYVLRLRADDGHSQAEAVRTWRAIKDDDNDGMDDDWEAATGVTDPAVDDDEDGVNNLNEFRTGTDPQSSASRLEMTRVALLPDGRVRVEWNSNQDQPAPWTVRYSVFVRQTLATGTWSLLTSGKLPEGLTSQFEWLPESFDRIFLKIEAE